MTELGRGFENRLRPQAYLFIASDNLGMFQRQMGVASVAVKKARHRCTNINFYRQFHRFVALRQMSSTLQSQKNGGHFKRRAAIGRKNNRITTTSRRSKQVPACVSNIDYTR